MVTMAKVAGIDAMPNHLQAAMSILQEKLQELITSASSSRASTSTDTTKMNSTGSLKRILDMASPLLGDDHATSSSRREGSKRVAVEGPVCRHFCAYHEELMDPSVWTRKKKKALGVTFGYTFR